VLSITCLSAVAAYSSRRSCGGIRIMTDPSEWLLIYMALVMVGGMFATQRL
jgi:hypothetical protein